jgi:AraC-like DNA-binding protein
MAQELGLTPRTFERRFRRSFGCEPRKWLAVEKMREAASLLAQGWNTKEIAAALGYGHPPSFFREFRRLYGCTTKEWQERLMPAPTAEFLPVGPQVSQNAIFLSQNAISPRLPLTEAI